MNYQLNIKIDQAGLNKIYASGQKVTIVKSVINNPLQTGNLPVAWLSFEPLQSNVINWQEQYLMYATTTALQSGASIQMTSQSAGAVQQGFVYTFASGGFTAQPGGSPNTYNLENQQQGNFNFGLAQTANINNVQTLAPLNAMPVLYNQTATFTPLETVSIYLSSYQNNGVVISQVASAALVVTLSSQSPSANIGFNDADNTFYLEGPALMTSQDFALSLAGNNNLDNQQAALYRQRQQQRLNQQQQQQYQQTSH